jgi:FkbM family methyltransferase
MKTDSNPFGARLPGRADRVILALTSAMPNTWLGLRAAILLRRAVINRLAKEGPDAALDVRRWGLALRLHPLDNGCEKNLLFTPQMYEPDELAELATAITAARAEYRGFVFVDVGANVGLFSLFVAAYAGPKARILAVEPEPGNMARLTFNVASNSGLPIRPVALALCEDEGEVALTLNRQDRGGTRARPLAASNANDVVRVPSRPLLTLLRVQDIAEVDALKIDVGGMEDVVLTPFFRDAPSSLWPKMILIEDSSHEWRTDLFALLAAKGYVVSTRTRQNVVLRLKVQSANGTASETVMPSRAMALR